MPQQIKIIVERHDDGYVAYPIGLKGVVREGNHIAMRRENPDGTITPLTLPNHRTIKSSTLRIILQQSGVSRSESLEMYYRR